MTTSLLDKLRFNKLTTFQVDRFDGENFILQFPDNWRQVRKLNNFSIVDFVNLKEHRGIFQISAYLNKNEDYIYDFDEASKELENQGFVPQLEVLNERLNTLVYAVSFSEGRGTQYRFETGRGRFRLFATLTFATQIEEEKDKNFAAAIEILKTLEIKN